MMRRLLISLALALAGCAHSQPAEQAANGPTPPSTDQAPRPKAVAPHVLARARLSGEMPHLPDSVIMAMERSGKSRVIGVYKTCLDTGGSVVSAEPMEGQGIAGADESIVAMIRTWKYKPQPIPVCSLTRFVFDFDGAPARATPPTAPSAPAAPAAPTPPPNAM